MNDKREQAEELVYKFMDKMDKTGRNTEYYKDLFAGMNDNQFLNFVKRELPFRLHVRPFEIEPTMSDAKEALDVIGVPLLEKVNLNYMYKNKNGEAVTSQPALIVYIPLKKMKQFITKKNSMSTNIGDRDMKSGLLLGHDKNAIESDREFESLAVMGLTKTMTELSKPRADAMKVKSEMYNAINTVGTVRLDELHMSIDDSLAKNTINTYLIGSQLYTNILGDDYYLPYTIANKERRIERK